MLFFTHLALAIVLFYLIGFVGKFLNPFGYEKLSAFTLRETAPAFNTIYRILFPTVFMFLSAVCLESVGLKELTLNIWHIVGYYFIIKIIYILVMDRLKLSNLKSILFTTVFSIIISYFIYTVSQSDGGLFLPEKKDLVNQFWIIIILFVYQIMNNSSVYTQAEQRKQKKIDDYVKYKYDILSKKYSSIINNKIQIKDLIVVIYSIMIAEDFNRPLFIRKIENILPKYKKTTGIMQVMSEGVLSDEESIIKACDIIYEAYINMDEAYRAEMYASSLARNIATKYNPSDEYANIVFEIALSLDKIKRH